ncbi:MAG: hypothetical protein AAGG50_12850 [Bacteroidota bacterium]
MLVLALVALPLAGCDSSDDDDGGDGPGSIPGDATGNFVAWSVGGDRFEARGDNTSPTTGFASATYVQGVGGVPTFNITATALNGTNPQTITFTVRGIDAAGDYTFNIVTDGALAGFVRTSVSGTTPTTTSYVATEDISITVDELTDTGARGSFSFNVVNQDDDTDRVTISNGRFSVVFN